MRETVRSASHSLCLTLEVCAKREAASSETMKVITSSTGFGQSMKNECRRLIDAHNMTRGKGEDKGAATLINLLESKLGRNLPLVLPVPGKTIY